MTMQTFITIFAIVAAIYGTVYYLRSRREDRDETEQGVGGSRSNDRRADRK